MLAVGQAREGGIEVDGASKLLGYTAFEERSGSRYHRPAEHTHTSRGATLQGLMLGALAAEEAGGGGGWQPEREEGAAQQLPLLEDENDEFCHICGLEVGLHSCCQDGWGSRKDWSARGGLAFFCFQGTCASLGRPESSVRGVVRMRVRMRVVGNHGAARELIFSHVYLIYISHLIGD